MIIPPETSSDVSLLMVVVFLSIQGCHSAPDPKQRDQMLKQERSERLGGRMELSEDEQRVDVMLQRLKIKEMSTSPFPPAKHFFTVRHLIQNSPVFKLIQKMPKGAALHLHNSAMVSVDWLVMNATYRPNCYICFTWGNSVNFIFSMTTPFPRWGCSLWKRLDVLRAGLSDVPKFDESLMRNLTLFTEDPETSYPTQDVVWERFETVFYAVNGLITYAPVLKDHIYQGLKELYDDNIQYVELRIGQSKAYELDWSTHDRAWTIELFRNITENFRANHPEFVGSRVILSAHRSSGVSQVKQAVQEAVEMQRRFPDIVAGFDLVGREDKGGTIWYFRDALSLPSKLGTKLPFFFHAGETNLDGTDVDRNVLDALLFNTSRIGHGFALVHHPLARQLSRTTRVPLEICPISNQVLKLVSDLRNHPAAVLMSDGHPMVVSSDDPSLFGTTGLSYDFYQAFVGIGGLDANLATLKELAINSIRYSSLSTQLQDKAMAVWLENWNKFIAENSET
ncbi:hypothetical protein DNTS_003129 [Danionella cerebrum]|uniref:adenosine deaminase n=1 Tax=Danionella cerebrum TaxID=2873325 RepID=A0A553N0G5_9TELE|nr:hypothetical protein DNTS_003129 [Danionella translucida]